MKAKNVQQIYDRYQTNAEVRETKGQQKKVKYQTDDVFRELHSSKMKQKYHDDELYHDKLSNKMREKMRVKYQIDEDYHNKTLENVKTSYHTPQGAKRKSNYQNMYHSSKKTKICLHERFNEQKKEMPTVICTISLKSFRGALGMAPGRIVSHGSLFQTASGSSLPRWRPGLHLAFLKSDFKEIIPKSFWFI
ncbi:Nucleoporin Gle1 [Frankliniella fusca]|uniref:Nucleoporin Gle1 n=1 Tax=Frankliniella fusca TaxID=407009 RepID=A0AAE1H6V3_9NEOP|nr:Nucleoporin Gle1 [Frankliniella fusca]